MKRLSIIFAALCLLTLCRTEAAAAALTGTLVQTIALPQTPVVSTAGGVAIAPDDSVAYLTDNVGNQIFKVTLSGAYPVTSWVTGLTVPRDCALNADGTTLYVLLDSGALYSINTTTAASTNIGTFSGTGGQTDSWRNLALSADGAYLYAVCDSAKFVWKYKLSDSSISVVAQPGGRFTSGLYATPDGQSLYVFASSGGPSTQGPLFKFILAQGRFEVAAGNGVNSDANGEAYLVASISSSGDVVTDTTGAYIYFASGGKLKLLSGGTVSQLSASTWTSSGGRLAYFHLSDKLISAAGNSVYVIS